MHGKRVTGFTNDEEEAVHLTKVVPFLVEDELKRLGGLYETVRSRGHLAPMAVKSGTQLEDHRPDPDREVAPDLAVGR